MPEGTVELPVTITGATSLSAVELAEARALKQVCDAAEGLDLKLGWGGESSEAGQVFLARANGRLVGYCSLDGDGTVAEICGMVAPDWRRRGLGLRLFETARASFRSGGGEQLYAICEDASASGQAFIGVLSGQRVFSEYRMELRAASLPPDDGALTIRQLAPSDEEALVAAARITASGFGRPLEQTLRHMRADVNQPAERIYLALAGDEPVGTFKLYAEDSSIGIYGFAVPPARQRQGWGRRMLARACALAREQGAARVTLEVETNNERAIALYTSSGFVAITTYGYYTFSRSLLTAGLNGASGEAGAEGVE
jgi:ribosomal protein S18 acetylase RimI-like enzyme